jgi:hypothetical protein
MTFDAKAPGARYVNTRLLSTGAGLAVVGGLLGSAGMVLVGATVFGAMRRWMNQLDVSPRDLAVLRLQQAKQATMAGARAWGEASVSNGNGKPARVTRAG